MCSKIRWRTLTRDPKKVACLCTERRAGTSSPWRRAKATWRNTARWLKTPTPLFSSFLSPCLHSSFLSLLLLSRICCTQSSGTGRSWRPTRSTKSETMLSWKTASLKSCYTEGRSASTPDSQKKQHPLFPFKSSPSCLHCHPENGGVCTAKKRK